jgi:hypothetical protein
MQRAQPCHAGAALVIVLVASLLQQRQQKGVQYSKCAVRFTECRWP